MSDTHRSAVAGRARWRRGFGLWGPPAIYALAIFACSSLSAPPAPPPQLTDKHVHLLVFGGLTLLLVRALAAGRWVGVTFATSTWAAVLAAVYGASDEWHQSYVPGRHADLADVAADALGAAMVAGVVFAVSRWLRPTGRADSRIDSGERLGQTP